MGSSGSVSSLNPIAAVATKVLEPVVKKGIAKVRGAADGPDAPKLDDQPSAEDVAATLPDRTRRRIQIARGQGGFQGTILTGPSGILGNDASLQRATLLGA